MKVERYTIPGGGYGYRRTVGVMVDYWRLVGGAWFWCNHKGPWVSAPDVPAEILNLHGDDNEKTD